MLCNIGEFHISILHLVYFISEIVDNIFQHMNVQEVRDIQVLNNVGGVF